MPGPLILLSSMATRHILADVLADYHQRTGTEAELRAMGGVDAAQRVRAGEVADIVLLAAGAMQKLAAEGHLVPGSLVPFARSGMAIAVGKNAPVPDISSGEAVRRAMLAARVGYSTGPSGDHLKALWAKWGIEPEIESRAVLALPGVPVAKLVAEGRADIGVQQLSELLGQSGIIIAGPLPADIQLDTIFTAGIAGVSKRAREAERLLAHLVSPATAATKLQHGMAAA